MHASIGRSKGNPLEYNLSQFTSVDDLVAAFHQVQDRGLSEEVPSIFFDEFDCFFDGIFGWLKYFLSPMQDGKFKGRANTYKIGRAIFVFAGGITETFADFTNGMECEEMKDAKVRDFVSRLRGYLNIKGIDTAEGEDESELWMRRAIMLRGLLELRANELFQREQDNLMIDNGVINAFLHVGRYKHGVRSMEAIIEMAKIDRFKFNIASLPQVEQLDMHVDGREFMKMTEIAFK